MSAERMLGEIEYQMNKYPGVNHFYFIGSLLNGNPRTLERFCDLVIKKRVKFSWEGQAIVHPQMDKRIIKKMAKAGCVWLGYGIESGSEKLRTRINKKFSNKNAIETLKASGNYKTNLLRDGKNMTEAEIKKLFEDKKALQKGHFRLTSGRHSSSYLQCALVLQYPDIAEKLGQELVARIQEENAGIPIKLAAVCAPAVGGIILGHVVARALNARAIFAEREGGTGPLKLRRGFSIKPGESILAVEDVITTGASLKEIIQLVVDAEAKLIGVAAVAERSAVPVHFGPTKTVLLKMPLDDYLPAECSLCKKGIPLEKPGSRV